MCERSYLHTHTYTIRSNNIKLIYAYGRARVRMLANACECECGYAGAVLVDSHHIISHMCPRCSRVYFAARHPKTSGVRVCARARAATHQSSVSPAGEAAVADVTVPCAPNRV